MVIVWRANYVEISKGMASSVVKVQAQDDVRAPGLQTPHQCLLLRKKRNLRSCPKPVWCHKGNNKQVATYVKHATCSKFRCKIDLHTDGEKKSGVEHVNKQK